MIIADTDVLIDFLRGQGEADRVALELETGSLHTTAITAFELASGAHSAKQHKNIEVLLAALTVMEFTREHAAIAGEMRRTLESSGQGIGMADYMIAAVCKANGGILLTRNRKHFERISGLQLSGIK